MTGLKQFIRPAILISVIGHVAVLATGLHLVVAHPSQAISPDAMVIDIVPSDEAPRFEGTPSDLHKSGSQMQPRPGNANTDARPPPKPAPQSPQQEQPPSKHQDEARKATQPLQAPEAAEAEIFRSEMAQVQASQPPPAPPQPSSEATPDQPDTADRLATARDDGRRTWRWFCGAGREYQPGRVRFHLVVSRTRQLVLGSGSWFLPG